MKASAQAIALVFALVLGSAISVAAHATEWTFVARLDDKPIGTHRFDLSDDGNGRTLLSEARFAVKFLGITAYRYRHNATEHWRGDCLSELSSTTDDDGKPVKVHLDGTALTGCAMSFAYWNPQIRSATRLVNAQTGQFENVQIARAGEATLKVRGLQTSATRWRITGPAQPIDVWYSAQGDWVGLDSTVAGGRKLSYRLE